MTPITKNSYVDNFESSKEGYVEVGYYDKKAYIKHKTLEIINPDNIPLNIQAMAMGIVIADSDNCFKNTPFGTSPTGYKPMNNKEAKVYLAELL